MAAHKYEKIPHSELGPRRVALKALLLAMIVATPIAGIAYVEATPAAPDRLLVTCDSTNPAPVELDGETYRMECPAAGVWRAIATGGDNAERVIVPRDRL